MGRVDFRKADLREHMAMDIYIDFLTVFSK